MTNEELDTHLDAILRASGSALRHYTMHKTREDMRNALQAAIAASQALPVPRPTGEGLAAELWDGDDYGRTHEAALAAFACAVWARAHGVTAVPLADLRGMAREGAMQAALDALRTAHTGLMWYRGMMPEYVDGSDGEADAEITAAIAVLEGALGVNPSRGGEQC